MKCLALLFALILSTFIGEPMFPCQKRSDHRGVAAFNPIEKIRKDYMALNRKATARHILLPKKVEMETILTLKQKIRNEAAEKYVVEVFEEAARRLSQDKDTASKGGLLGEDERPTPIGYCARCPELDRARFQVPLGEVSGPIQSSYGNHLVLVSERTNCPKLDGEKTRLVKGENGLATYTTSLRDSEESSSFAQVVSFQLFFWVAVYFAGGLLAEVLERAASTVSS
mmetsp:Transcript_9622/g.18197  ORF Transcript_9622/g.18197 Transcript_9622/m.18197 type:complete len:227 (-) Transcript_9622:65-745(-)